MKSKLCLILSIFSIWSVYAISDIRTGTNPYTGDVVTNSYKDGSIKYSRLGNLTGSRDFVITDLLPYWIDEDGLLNIANGSNTNLYLCTQAAADIYLSQSDAYRDFVPVRRTINGIPLSSNVQLSATDVEAAPASLSSQVNVNSRTISLWETYWGGSNVVLQVTNYNSKVTGELPKLRLLELVTETHETGEIGYNDWVWQIPSELPSDIILVRVTNTVHNVDNNYWELSGYYINNSDEQIQLNGMCSCEGEIPTATNLTYIVSENLTITATRSTYPITESSSHYEEIWNDSNKFENFSNHLITNILLGATNTLSRSIDNKLVNKADRAWGKYASSGEDAPGTNLVYMTAPTTYFAGGLSFEKVAVGNGTISVLVNNGAQAYTYGDQGQFRIGDASGIDYFGYDKTESYTVGTTTDGITVNNQVVALTYHIIASTFPIIYYCDDLTTRSWVQLNDAAGEPVEGAPYTVTWDDSIPGTFIAYLNVGDSPSGFFKAETSVVGECVFKTSMKFDPMGGIMCTNTTPNASIPTVTIKPVYNNGVITWQLAN